MRREPIGIGSPKKEVRQSNQKNIVHVYIRGRKIITWKKAQYYKQMDLTLLTLNVNRLNNSIKQKRTTNGVRK